MGTGNHPSQTRGDGQMVQYSIESNFRQFEKTWHVYKISSLELFFIVDINVLTGSKIYVTKWNIWHLPMKNCMHGNPQTNSWKKSMRLRTNFLLQKAMDSFLKCEEPRYPFHPISPKGTTETPVNSTVISATSHTLQRMN